MIDHKHKVIFIHIPKNAGQSIESVFIELLGLKWETRAPLLLRPNDKLEIGPPRLAHLKAKEYVKYNYISEELFNEYFKFTYVRNPWDRMISIYKYYRYNQRCGFKYYVMNIFRKKIWNEKHWFVGPQSDFVYDENGNKLVDFIGRFENIQNDFYKICDYLSLTHLEIPHRNSSGKIRPKLSFSSKMIFFNYLASLAKIKKIPSHKKYQDYYDVETREYVSEIYNSDIENFGYKFE